MSTRVPANLNRAFETLRLPDFVRRMIAGGSNLPGEIRDSSRLQQRERIHVDHECRRIPLLTAREFLGALQQRVQILAAARFD